MRRALDALYLATAWLAALCLVAIAVLVSLQLGGRILDGVLKLMGFRPYGFVILSLSEIAGYLLANASCLALAYALKSGAHIRVTMMLGALGDAARQRAETFALAVAAAFSGWMTVALARLALDSYRFNEVSTGLIPVPLVWPQIGMAVGLGVLTISFLDELGIVLLRGRPSFRAAEDAITLGKEG